MTRFKELDRINKAVESRDEAELRWANDYCRSRLGIARTSAQERYWKALLRQISGLRHRLPDETYHCGLQPGDQVRLRKDLVIRNARGKATGKVHRSGEVWKVLPGSCSVADDVWFQTPDGSPHTWDDDAERVFEWFEKV